MMGPSTPLLLYAATLVAGLALAWGARRLGRDLDLREAWRAGDGAALERWRRFARLVLLQSRVARTARGRLHLLFVGALAALTAGTAIVMADWDVARPLGFRLLQGTPYIAFATCMDLAGLLLVTALLAALVQRLRTHPASPRLHKEMLALLGALLFIGLTGFTVEALGQALRPNPEPGRFVAAWLASGLEATAGPPSPALYVGAWWIHGLAVLALAAVAPRTALAHAALGSLQALLTKEEPPPAASTPFDLRELLEKGQFDVTVGARSAREFPARARLSFLACTACGRCDDACPIAQGGGPLSPRSVVLSLQDELQTPMAGSEPSGSGVPEAAIWACTACGACAEACPVLVRPAEAILEMRRSLVGAFRMPAPAADALARLERLGNPHGVPPTERAAGLRRLGLPTIEQVPRPDVLYWVGCAGACDARVARVVVAVATLLKAAGISFATLGEAEACCGEMARRLGEEGRFQMLAQQNIALLEAHGVKRIVTHCAHCHNTLRNEYPSLGGDFRVQHHTELLAELLATGRLTVAPPGDGATTAIHDPCWLGRYNRLARPPRDILVAGLGRPATELEPAEADTACCGGGGGGYFCDLGGVGGGDRPAARRIAQARARGVTRLATACPYCLKMLESAAGDGLAVQDVAEVLVEALGPEATATRNQELPT